MGVRTCEPARVHVCERMRVRMEYALPFYTHTFVVYVIEGVTSVSAHVHVCIGRKSLFRAKNVVPIEGRLCVDCFLSPAPGDGVVSGLRRGETNPA